MLVAAAVALCLCAVTQGLGLGLNTRGLRVGRLGVGIGMSTRPPRACAKSKGLRMLAEDGAQTEFTDDMPKQFKVRDLVESSTEKPKSKPAAGSAKSFTFGSSSIEDFKSSRTSREPKQMPLPSKIEDLNGIPPLKPFQFSLVAAIMAAVGWKLSNYLSAHFAVAFVTSELYPVQRLAIVARNVVVGMTTMGTGFSGLISLGLFGLGVAVSVGVAKGELDPNKPRV